MSRKGTWAQTYPMGIQFWPCDPRTDEIYIEDIAHHLSNICRYNGGCAWHYSVAQHSVYVSQRFNEPALQLWGLLHDASEAYIGDLIRPLKAMEDYARQYKAVERILMAAIILRFGLDAKHIDWANGDAPLEPPEIIDADQRMLVTEKKQILMMAPAEWTTAQGGKAEPFPNFKIERWTPEQAETAFLKRFAEIKGA